MFPGEGDRAAQRGKRIAAAAVGGGGGVAISNYIVAFWGAGWSAEQVAGFVGMVSWLFTLGSVCFWDLRGLVCTVIEKVYLRNRRKS